jgi:hypothetical protein
MQVSEAVVNWSSSEVVKSASKSYGGARVVMMMPSRSVVRIHIGVVKSAQRDELSQPLTRWCWPLLVGFIALDSTGWEKTLFPAFALDALLYLDPGKQAACCGRRWLDVSTREM